MKFQAILLIFFALFAFSCAQRSLPCVMCSRQFAPICAEPVVGGKPETFDNECIMMAKDCGFQEHRKIN